MNVFFLLVNGWYREIKSHFNNSSNVLDKEPSLNLVLRAMANRVIPCGLDASASIILMC